MSIRRRIRAITKPRLSAFGEAWSPLRWYLNRRADVFFLWFPKTGGTWARLLLHTALTRHFGVEGAAPLELEPLHDLDARIPRIRPFHDDEPHWKRPDQLRTHKERYRNRKVMLLVRDPRDAIVSLYFQMTKRWNVVDESLSAFLFRERGSLRSFIRYYNIWAAQRHVPEQLLLVRYEDVHADTATWLRQMLEFIGVPEVADPVIRHAIEFNDIARLRERERAGDYTSRRLRPGDPGDLESFKARRGRVGGFVDYLSQTEIDRATQMIEQLDPWFGYTV